MKRVMTNSAFTVVKACMDVPIFMVWGTGRRYTGGMKRLVCLILMFFVPLVPATALAQSAENAPILLEAAPLAEGGPAKNRLKEKLRAGAGDDMRQGGFDRLKTTPPDIPKVTFLKITPPATLQDRIDALLFGVSTDIPPEYDHYGYEMRRYMVHVGGIATYGDPARIREALGNIRKAEIVFEYWRDALLTEIKTLEDLVEQEGAGSSHLTRLRYNSGIVRAFLTEAQGWITNNRAVLQFLLDHAPSYRIHSGQIVFGDIALRSEFLALYKARDTSRAIMNEYVPFMRMVY